MVQDGSPCAAMICFSSPDLLAIDRAIAFSLKKKLQGDILLQSSWSNPYILPIAEVLLSQASYKRMTYTCTPGS